MTTNNIITSTSLVPYNFPIEANELNLSEKFKDFFGKEYDPASNDSTEHVIYNFVDGIAKESKTNANFALSFSKLHPLNQQAILKLALNISQAKKLDVQVKKFTECLEIHEGQFNLDPLEVDPKFNPQLEKPSYSAALKIAGAFIVGSLIGALVQGVANSFSKAQLAKAKLAAGLKNCKAQSEYDLSKCNTDANIDVTKEAIKWKKLVNERDESLKLLIESLKICEAVEKKLIGTSEMCAESLEKSKGSLKDSLDSVKELTAFKNNHIEWLKVCTEKGNEECRTELWNISNQRFIGGLTDIDLKYQESLRKRETEEEKRKAEEQSKKQAAIEKAVAATEEWEKSKCKLQVAREKNIAILHERAIARFYRTSREHMIKAMDVLEIMHKESPVSDIESIREAHKKALENLWFWQK